MPKYVCLDGNVVRVGGDTKEQRVKVYSRTLLDDSLRGREPAVFVDRETVKMYSAIELFGINTKDIAVRVNTRGGILSRSAAMCLLILAKTSPSDPTYSALHNLCTKPRISDLVTHTECFLASDLSQIRDALARTTWERLQADATAVWNALYGAGTERDELSAERLAMIHDRALIRGGETGDSTALELQVTELDFHIYMNYRTDVPWPEFLVGQTVSQVPQKDVLTDPYPYLFDRRQINVRPGSYTRNLYDENVPLVVRETHGVTTGQAEQYKFKEDKTVLRNSLVHKVYPKILQQTSENLLTKLAFTRNLGRLLLPGGLDGICRDGSSHKIPAEYVTNGVTDPAPYARLELLVSGVQVPSQVTYLDRLLRKDKSLLLCAKIPYLGVTAAPPRTFPELFEHVSQGLPNIFWLFIKARAPAIWEKVVSTMMPLINELNKTYMSCARLVFLALFTHRATIKTSARPEQAMEYIEKLQVVTDPTQRVELLRLRGESSALMLSESTKEYTTFVEKYGRGESGKNERDVLIAIRDRLLGELRSADIGGYVDEFIKRHPGLSRAALLDADYADVVKSRPQLINDIIDLASKLRLHNKYADRFNALYQVDKLISRRIDNGQVSDDMYTLLVQWEDQLLNGVIPAAVSTDEDVMGYLANPKFPSMPRVLRDKVLEMMTDAYKPIWFVKFDPVPFARQFTKLVHYGMLKNPNVDKFKTALLEVMETEWSNGNIAGKTAINRIVSIGRSIVGAYMPSNASEQISQLLMTEFSTGPIIGKTAVLFAMRVAEIVCINTSHTPYIDDVIASMSLMRTCAHFPSYVRASACSANALWHKSMRETCVDASRENIVRYGLYEPAALQTIWPYPAYQLLLVQAMNLEIFDRGQTWLANIDAPGLNNVQKFGALCFATIRASLERPNQMSVLRETEKQWQLCRTYASITDTDIARESDTVRGVLSRLLDLPKANNKPISAVSVVLRPRYEFVRNEMIPTPTERHMIPGFFGLKTKTGRTIGELYSISRIVHMYGHLFENTETAIVRLVWEIVLGQTRTVSHLTRKQCEYINKNANDLTVYGLYAWLITDKPYKFNATENVATFLRDKYAEFGDVAIAMISEYATGVRRFEDLSRIGDLQTDEIRPVGNWLYLLQIFDLPVVAFNGVTITDLRRTNAIIEPTFEAFLQKLFM